MDKDRACTLSLVKTKLTQLNLCFFKSKHNNGDPYKMFDVNLWQLLTFFP